MAPLASKATPTLIALGQFHTYTMLVDKQRVEHRA